MKKISIIFIFSIIIVHPVPGYSEDEKIKIYFGNGMQTKQESDAWKSMDYLLPSIEEGIKGSDLEGCVDYSISYNPSGGFFKDLFEAGFQILGLADREIWRFLAGLDIMPDELQERYAFYASQITQDLLNGELKIQEHIDLYNENLCAGNKVIVVAHSQGNLYANVAYLDIEESVKNGFGIVSVANPDTSVAGGGPHTNISEDLVIKFTPGAILPSFPNFEDSSYQNPEDWSGHKFIDSYLAEGRPAETKILNDIVDTIDQLEWPEGDCDKAYALVTISNNSSEPMCIVWDIEKNQYAKISDNNLITARFPINISEISNWLQNTEKVDRPLYSTDRCRDGQDLNPSCNISPNSDECTNSVTSISECPDVDGNYNLINEGTIIRRYIRNEITGGRFRFEMFKDVLMRSYESSYILNILNSIPNKITSIRTERDIQYIMIQPAGFTDSYQYIKGCPGNIYERITPLGSLATWQLAAAYNEHNYNWPEYDDLSGENYFDSPTGARQTIGGIYSEKAMIQIFTYELKKRRTYRPCGVDESGLWVNSDPYWFDWKPCPQEYLPIEPLVDFTVLASADIVEDAENQDPRTLGRNSEFEGAIKELYNNFKVYISEPIPDYEISVELLKPGVTL